uniref:Reverse transcriptase domain-containing protein n=2 Tax=Nicotiana TaxID=4085 RepID=A0A1S3XKS4_TOBAC|nr:PREDICTED: uncharacterized protein LOC107766282 [Nicotiana tabacum]
MRLMGFPEKYVNWAMANISTISYSIIVNGKPIKPFEAKRWLRQEDPLAPLLFIIAMEYLCRLLKQLGNNKNFKFHPRCAKLNLIQLGFADDLLLFCKGEEKSVVEIHNQFQRFSKASGLVANTSKSSVYFGGVNNRVQQRILRFLWTRNVEPTRKALIAWDKLYVPKSAGGLNFINIEIWNKAAICKLLWNICKKKEKMWVQWVHTYYIKGNSTCDTEPRNASWVIQKFFKAKAQFQEAGYSEEDVKQLDSFSTKQMYKRLQGGFQKVPWRGLVSNNKGMPKWIFILRLAILDRLATKERLARWGLMDETKPLQWQGIVRMKKQWHEEVQWAVEKAAGKSAGAELYRITLAAVVYHVWQARNKSIFQKEKVNFVSIVKVIVQEIHIRAQSCKKLDTYLSNMNWYPV